MSICLRLFKKSLITPVFMILVACSGVALNTQDPRFGQLQRSFEITDIPFFPQIEDQCGPSSLATVLGVRGVQISPKELRSKLYIPEKKGAVTTEMIAQARRFGFLVYPLESDFFHILSEIEACNPVLVMQNLGFNWLPKWHFSVAIGYDLNNQTLSLRSGTQYKHDVDFGLFRKTWQRAGSWAIVIIAPEQLPKTATADGLIKAATELEQLGETDTALRVYQAILNQWPENDIALFGAGNSAFSLGDFDQAELFFSKYLAKHPQSISAWNNLAYSLAELGCTSAAKYAINCALKIDSKNKNLRESHKEILEYATHKKNSDCQAVTCF